ncbi:MAG: hypothetical protein M3388_17865 [Acidobacteriota bacterium]|nr:hypothetical protein [Acidobacteriota bacterium]
MPEGLAGRALIPKEVRYLLSGSDRETPTGARDYALILLDVPNVSSSLGGGEFTRVILSLVARKMDAQSISQRRTRADNSGPARCQTSDRRILTN